MSIGQVNILSHSQVNCHLREIGRHLGGLRNYCDPTRGWGLPSFIFSAYMYEGFEKGGPEGFEKGVQRVRKRSKKGLENKGLPPLSEVEIIHIAEKLKLCILFWLCKMCFRIGFGAALASLFVPFYRVFLGI